MYGQRANIGIMFNLVDTTINASRNESFNANKIVRRQRLWAYEKSG